MERRLSFVAQQTYTQMSCDLNEEQSTCAISLSNPGEIKEYHGWIGIPVGNGVIHQYCLQTFLEYIKQYANKIPCPNRSMPDLRYMKTRCNRLAKLPAVIAAIPINVITQQFNEKVAAEFFGLELKNSNSSTNSISNSIELTPTNTEQLMVNCGLCLLDTLKLVHKTFTTVQEVEHYFSEKKADLSSYLIRLSTRGNTNKTGECTVFTITMMLETGVFHIRFMDVHCVGIYVISRFPNNEIQGVDLNSPSLLNNCNLREVLAAVSYQPPPFACIADVLSTLQLLNYISIKKIIVV